MQTWNKTGQQRQKNNIYKVSKQSTMFTCKLREPTWRVTKFNQENSE